MNDAITRRLDRIIAMMDAMHGRDVMDVSQLAAYLDHSESHIWGLVALNKIPVTRTPGVHGKRRGGVRFHKPAIDQWLRDRTVFSADGARQLQDGRRKWNVK